MVYETAVLPLLLEACPGFRTTWEKHIENWGDDEPALFIEAGEFARYLVDGVQDNRTDCFPAAFAVIERILIEGDDDAKVLASIGLLEDLQTLALNTLPDPETFLHWLGPESHKAWSAIEEMWRGKHSLADVVRAEVPQPDSGGPD